MARWYATRDTARDRLSIGGLASRGKREREREREKGRRKRGKDREWLEEYFITSSRYEDSGGARGTVASAYNGKIGSRSVSPGSLLGVGELRYLLIGDIIILKDGIAWS